MDAIKHKLMRWMILVPATLLTVSPIVAQSLDDSPRMTPLVKVIQEIEPAVIGLFVPTEEQFQFSSGSGTIIHPDGYVLTNHHVLPRTDGFAVFRGKAVRFVVVGRLPEKDIALLRLRDVTGPLPFVPLGHSHDVMNGESVAVAGNPGGRGVVFTSGIVSSKRVLLDAPNALAMTQFETGRRDGFIQFDAASNRGNSGGPLVNMEGELIGIVSALMPQEQNVGFAIPVDRVRELFERVLEPEVVYQKSVGVELNPRADEAIVVKVVAGSVAARAGLKAGDTILSAGGSKLRHAADWTMLLNSWLPSGKPLGVIARRGTLELPMNLAPDNAPPLQPVDTEDTEPGLTFKLYHGDFNLIPDFSNLEPARSGVSADLDLDQIRGDREDEFAVSIDALLKIQREGVYRLTVISDDGSRVYLHGELFIDHDGNHPPMPASRLLRAKAGLHPIRIEHFEGSGDQVLEIQLERFDTPGELEENEFFHAK